MPALRDPKRAREIWTLSPPENSTIEERDIERFNFEGVYEIGGRGSGVFVDPVVFELSFDLYRVERLEVKSGGPVASIVRADTLEKYARLPEVEGLRILDAPDVGESAIREILADPIPAGVFFCASPEGARHLPSGWSILNATSPGNDVAGRRVQTPSLAHLPQLNRRGKATTTMSQIRPQPILDALENFSAEEILEAFPVGSPAHLDLADRVSRNHKIEKPWWLAIEPINEQTEGE